MGKRKTKTIETSTDDEEVDAVDTRKSKPKKQDMGKMLMAKKKHALDMALTNNHCPKLDAVAVPKNVAKKLLRRIIVISMISWE